MKAKINLIAAAAVVLCAGAVAGGDVRAHETETAAQRVIIHQGGSRGAEAAQARVENGVRILYGRARTPARAPFHHAGLREQPKPLARGGDTLWLLDRAEDKVTACRLFKTVNVGQHVVRCASADLSQAIARGLPRR